MQFQFLSAIVSTNNETIGNPMSDRQVILRTESLSASFENKKILNDINLEISKRNIMAIIGPSGCGKSTLLRCINRMHELIYGSTLSGRIYFENKNIYDKSVDPILLRRRIGLVFQKPNPFPSMSIKDNVLSGLWLTQKINKKTDSDHLVENALQQAVLWDEVKDRLDDSSLSLSGGQQQRLCIARALASKPDVLLLDEPCSSLDPIATQRIESLLLSLKNTYTIVIVTHNMRQAARISNTTAFLLSGRLIEYGETTHIFTSPQETQTEDYLSGHFD